VCRFLNRHCIVRELYVVACRRVKQSFAICPASSVVKYIKDTARKQSDDARRPVAHKRMRREGYQASNVARSDSVEGNIFLAVET